MRWAFASWLVVMPALADGPLSPPSDYKAYSSSRRCYAFLDAKNRTTTVVRETKGNPPARLWDMPGWFRVVSLSDDCEHLVVGFDGSNLLPLDFQPDVVMLRFFNRGKLLREVKLNELVRDQTKLRRTASHFYWGYYVGFDNRDRYVLETVDGGHIAFDATTGERLPAGKR